MDEQKMEEDEQQTVRKYPQQPYEVNEQDNAHNYSQKACEVSEQAFNEFVEDFSEEADLIDFDADKLNAMREEFLLFVTGTYYTHIETSVGWLYLAYSGHRLQFVSLEEEAIFLEKAESRLGTRPIRDKESHQPEELIKRVRTTIDSHVIYNEPIDLSHLSAFEKMVLKQVRYILPTEVCFYEALAQTIGQPDAVEEIKRVIANNPFPVVVPCHRMVDATGYLGDYCSGGIATKKRLLEREGVAIQGNYAAEQEELEIVKVAEKTISQLPPKQQEALLSYLEWLINYYQYIRTHNAFPGVDYVDFLEIYTPQQFLVSPTATNLPIGEGQGTFPWLDEAEKCRPKREQAIEDIIQRHNYVTVLGAPGSGKTTVLRHLALKYARNIRASLHSGYNDIQQLLPVPLQLADYVQNDMPVGNQLRDFLVDYFAGHGCQTAGLAELLATAFDAGWCLVLLDGLDEIGTMQQQIKLVRHINHFVGHYSPPNNHFVITSRITGYYQYLANSFVYCTIQGMDSKTTNAFLGKWITVVEKGRELYTYGPLSSGKSREKQVLEATLQRLVHMTHSRITYRIDDFCQLWGSITPLLVQVVVIIYYTLVHQKGRCFEITQYMPDLMDEVDAYHNRQRSYSAQDYLISLFSEEIYKHYLDRHIKNCDKALEDEPEAVGRFYTHNYDDARDQSDPIMERSRDKGGSQQPPNTAVEDIIHFFFKNPDEATRLIVKRLYIDAREKAHNIIAQSRGVMETAG